MSDDPKSEQPVELDLPDGLAEARRAVEVARAWIADGNLMVSLNSDVFEDRLGEWGRLLAQVGHHIARAAALNGRMEERAAIDALRQGFDAMMPVHEPALSGKVRGRTNH